jgi:hypothetical protein
MSIFQRTRFDSTGTNGFGRSSMPMMHHVGDSFTIVETYLVQLELMHIMEHHLLTHIFVIRVQQH